MNEPHKLHRSINAWQECMRPKTGKDTVCISYNGMMSIYPRVSWIYTACHWVHLHYPCISVSIYIQSHRWYTPYYSVLTHLVTVTETNMIDEMLCGYGTLGTTGVRIQHKVSGRAAAEVSATLEVSRRAAQRSQLLQHLNNLIVKFYSILNAPPSLKVLWGTCVNALAECESTLQTCRRGWEHLEVLRSTGEGCQSAWEVCVWLRNQMYFSYWKRPWVSERMWSVNIDVSISGEYQTLGGHSCRSSE